VTLPALPHPSSLVTDTGFRMTPEWYKHFQDTRSGLVAQIGDAAFFATRADAQAYNPRVPPDFLVVAGHTVVGDCPPIYYAKVAAEPSHIAKLQILQGTWYEFRNAELDSRQVGVHLAASDAVDEFQDFVDAAAALEVPAVVADGETYDFPSGSIDLPAGIILRGHGAILRRTVDLTIPLLQGTSVDGGRVDGLKLKYTASTTTTTTTNSTALFLDTCNNWSAQNVVVEGAFYIGIYFRDCRRGSIEDCQCWGLYNRGIYVAADTYTEDIHTSRCLVDGYEFGTSNRLTNHMINTNGFGTGTGKNITFSDCIARHSSTSPQGEGFGISERIGFQKLENCHATDCYHGFLLQEANSQPLQHVSVVNCQSDGCELGFVGAGADYFAISGCIAYDCVDGYYFDDCENFILSGNIARDCSEDGFEFDGDSLAIAVSGNISDGNTANGFLAADTVDYINAKGNISLNNGTAYTWGAGTGHDTTGNI